MGPELGPCALPGTAIGALVSCCMYQTSRPFPAPSSNSNFWHLLSFFVVETTFQVHPKIPPMIVSEFHPNLRNKHLLSPLSLTPLWTSHLWTLDNKKTIFTAWDILAASLGCVGHISLELSHRLKWLRGASCLGQHAFNSISVIARALWNNDACKNQPSGLFILKKTEDQLYISSNHIMDRSVEFLWTGSQIRKIIYY